LQVLAPAALDDPGALLANLVLSTEDPALFIENKLLYLAPVLEDSSTADFSILKIPSEGEPTAIPGRQSPTYRLEVRGAPPATLTIAAYGYMAELARQAALVLAYEHEIFAELVVPTQLAPFQAAPVLDSVRRTGRLLVLEEGSLSFGWGAEVLARVQEGSPDSRPTARRLAARETPIPASPALEEAALPGVTDIVQAAVEASSSS
jgi:pyruvate/2-oxoglutarate/acetoin dehydrogenase E1 component